MKKIPTLFVRDEDERAYVTEEVTPGCEWVIAGLGIPTRKYDGTCTMLDDSGKWWARREVKPGKEAPANFMPVDHDKVTGKTMGWEPIEQSSYARWHAEALVVEERRRGRALAAPGTYELVGPKVNGNPERCGEHMLIEHATAQPYIAPELKLTFDGVRDFVLALAEKDGCEGLVWHHPDGRMVKIKAKDFRR